MEDWDRKVLHRVYYTRADGKCGEAFFSDRQAAEIFSEAARKEKGCSAVISKFEWRAAVEP